MLYYTLIWVLCSLGQTFSKSWNRLHCSLQAFGYYCLWLPGLTTKSIHHYPYSYYFHTTFTFIAQRIPPLTLSFNIVPLDPLAPKFMTRLSAGTQIPMTQRLARINYIIKCHIQAVTSIKLYFGSHTLKYQNKFITPCALLDHNTHNPQLDILKQFLLLVINTFWYQVQSLVPAEIFAHVTP